MVGDRDGRLPAFNEAHFRSIGKRTVGARAAATAAANNDEIKLFGD